MGSKGPTEDEEKDYLEGAGQGTPQNKTLNQQKEHFEGDSRLPGGL